MAIRILASDLDGTLLNGEGRISPETAEAVRMAQKNGMRFVAATGRAWSTAYPILREAGIEAGYVLLNGAEFRVSSGEVIYQESMRRDTAKKLMDYLSCEGIDFEINTDQGDFSTNTQICQTADRLDNLFHFWSRNPKILKFFIFSKGPVIPEEIKKYITKQKEISVTSSARWNLEITAAGAQKGKMLQRAAEFYQVPAEEVMVFGDGENDENMFREFRHSRAVANAVPNIQNLAEKVISNNCENGVAEEINHILKMEVNRMGFFKKKEKEEPVKSLKAFVPGKVISITEVNDQVFSSKALGDGVAIQPTAQIVTAPCDGVISMIAEGSNHAIGMTLNNGVELLLHIGLDTVSLNGEGFHVFVKADAKVKQGDKLMEFDKNFIESKGFETTCVLVVTNSDDYPDAEYLSGMEAVQNETEICRF